MKDNNVPVFNGYNNHHGFKDIMSAIYSVAVEELIDEIK